MKYRTTRKKAGLLERRVVLIGHSMGGRIAMRYAADYPQDLAKNNKNKTHN